jgi:hypothetical protein
MAARQEEVMKKFIPTLAKAVLIAATLPLGLFAKAQTPPPTRPASVGRVAKVVYFQNLDKSKGNNIRVDPTVDFTKYKHFVLAPSAYQPIEKGNRLNDHEVQQLTSQLDASLQNAFQNEAAGAGPALRVEPFITSVKLTDTAVNVVSFALIQMPLSYGAASVRFSLFDSVTGEMMAEVYSDRNARPWNVYPWNILQNFRANGQSSVILKSDAKRLRKDEAILLNHHASAALNVSTNVKSETSSEVAALAK